MGRVEIIRVRGGARLEGEVFVAGAKNSVLKLMAAALLLAEGRTVIENVPRILDVTIMAELLRRLGCEVEWVEDELTIDVPAEPGTEADYDLVRRLRASICVLGPLLTRRGRVKVAYPGDATRSGRVGWICTSTGWSGWARRCPASTAS